MQNLVPSMAPLPIPPFTPVPRKARYDGWTDERQQAFIAALAETGSVTAACRRINMSTTGAYQLRMAEGAEGFRAAWDAALAHGVQKLADIAMERAMEGVPVPVFHKGEQCGERRRYNDYLLMFILRHRLPHLYGQLAEQATDPKAQAARVEAAAAEAQAQAHAWVEKQLRAFVVLARRHRVLLRQAVLALYAGDQPGAADYEHQARAIERTIDKAPDSWDLRALIEQHVPRPDTDPAISGDPDDPRWCGALADQGDETLPPPDRPCLADLPRDERGYLIPALPLIDAVRAPTFQMRCGPTALERGRAREAAAARIRAAQAEWLASYDEDAWAKWKGTA